jgi:xylulokinase
VKKVLISSKDYVIGRLTGQAAGDVTACATAGAMNIAEKKWDPAILEAAGVSPEQMPTLYFAHEAVGTVTEAAAQESGYLPGTKVYAGAGDAGATTLASGITNPGEYNINLGTSGWVATVSDHTVQTEGGVFNLAAMPDHCYINVVPFLNAGNVHRFISRIMTPGERREIDYALVEQILEKSEAGSHQVMFLPYIVGERFPVMDACVRGTFVGITPETDRADLIRACLEGVAFSIRQGIESLGKAPQKISIIGGGARSAAWCRIFADVLQKPVYVYRNADVLPALAIASAVLLGQGKIHSYSDFTDRLQTAEYCTIYQPDSGNAGCYDAQYKKYLSLYPTVKEFYK